MDGASVAKAVPVYKSLGILTSQICLLGTGLGSALQVSRTGVSAVHECRDASIAAVGSTQARRDYNRRRF